MDLSSKERTIKIIKDIVYMILRNEGLLRGEWNNGVVVGVISASLLSVRVNGSEIIQKIPCNPSVTFAVGDEVFVHFVNGDTKNKFVPYKRGVQ